MNCETAERLSALDAELASLFGEKINTCSIYSIQLHRGKISKRILLYEQHVNQLQHLYKCASFNDSKEKLSSLYHKYSNNLANYKNRLNDWWISVEKKFNQLCLTSFVAESNTTKSVARHAKLEEKLSETNKMMLSLDSQMQASESSILKTSEYITEHEAFYQTFKTHLTNASSLLSQLHYRTSKRKRFVYSCFFFQIFICILVMLRRLSIIRIMLWILSLLNKIVKIPIHTFGVLLTPFKPKDNARTSEDPTLNLTTNETIDATNG